MWNNYFTLRALVSEWRAWLPGSGIREAYSQSRGELAIALCGARSLHVVIRPPEICAFGRRGHARRRRNVAGLLPGLAGRTISGVNLAQGDRIITMDLQGGSSLRLQLFGARANVYLVGADGCIEDAFLGARKAAGARPEPPRSATVPADVRQFRACWRGVSVAAAIKGAVPFFDAELAREAMRRADVAEQPAMDVTESELERLFLAVKGLEQDLLRPAPRIYWDAAGNGKLALAATGGLDEARLERFETVNKAVRVHALQTMGRRQYAQRRSKLARTLGKALAAARQREDNLRREAARPGRHGAYERWAHLLMASAPEPPGRDQVALEDWFGDGTPVTIRLDPSLGTVSNAERYYAKARKARQSREHLAERLETARRSRGALGRAWEALERVGSAGELDAFEKSHRDVISAVRPRAREGAVPRFRRFSLGEGYAVWVSRNQREADTLTFGCARKHDLWMHARGYSGAHTVLRLPGRNATPGKEVIERAASIAAYFSKGRHSGLVPVTVTRRKHVRKPRGALPGVVAFEREEVVIVPPECPPG